MKNLISLSELVEKPKRTKRGRGSTDFGNVSQVVPATCTYIAIGPESLIAYSKEFAAASVSEIGDHVLIVGAKAMALTYVDLFSDPNLLQKAKEEFHKK